MEALSGYPKMTTRKPTWAEKHVIECAGIPIDEASDEHIELAAVALERCYYIDRATDYFLDVLQGHSKY